MNTSGPIIISKQEKLKRKVVLPSQGADDLENMFK